VYPKVIATEDRISEKWPWNGEFLRLFLLLPSVIGITATIATIPFAGVHALWFLTAILAGVVFYYVYGNVGRRVEALKADFVTDGADIAEALIVIGKIHSPGIVVLYNNQFELVPIVGKRQTIPLAETKLVGEGHWLPGKYVWGKRAFTFNAAIFNPLAFAVPESVGLRWSAILHECGK
jgi:hypothetical protein